MASRYEKTMPNGETVMFQQQDGFVFREDLILKMMPAKDLGQQLKWIKDTPIRDDDVILCAFPKTGTHWTWEIVNMIQRRTTEYQKDTKRVAMLEFLTPEMTSSLPSPRVLNTHFTHNLLPAGIKEKRCKIITVFRNPKDVAVSLYFHFSTMFKHLNIPQPPPIDLFARAFRTQLDAFCPYLWYVKHWEQFYNDYPDYPFLQLTYEDMQKDLATEVKKIATFLGMDLDNETVGEISKKCEFNNMKEAHKQKSDSARTISKEGTAFVYRKGTVGDWKNFLTVAESEEYDKWIEEEMKDSKIKFQFE